MGLICEVSDVSAIAQVLRPLVRATKALVKFPYDSVCLKVTLSGDCRFDKQVPWANMLYRAFYLFEEFNGEMGDKANTTGYEAEQAGAFRLSVDKPTPNHKHTMTTGGEGPYTVDLRAGTCECRYFAGHPYVIKHDAEGVVLVGSELYRQDGFSKFQLKDWRVLQKWFPELDWRHHTCETGTDPSCDCKHLVASHLLMLACLADREGITDRLPEATQKVVERYVDHALAFNLFKELK